jgi:hypothetical protein
MFKRMIGLRTVLFVGLSALMAAQPALAEGRAGGSISISDTTANFGVFSLKETAVDITRVGADFFFNEPGDKMLSADLKVTRKGLTNNQNLDFGVKTKAFYFLQHDTDYDGFGLMLGVTARYWIPAEMPASAFVEILHAPQIITGGKAENLTEMLVRAEVRILPKVNGYVGYRYVGTKFSGSSNTYELDSNAHIGVEVAF